MQVMRKRPLPAGWCVADHLNRWGFRQPGNLPQTAKGEPYRMRQLRLLRYDNGSCRPFLMKKLSSTPKNHESVKGFPTLCFCPKHRKPVLCYRWDAANGVLWIVESPLQEVNAS